ncbi:MAG TPA: c-type cytochrome [Nitrospiria bacterium]|nr:c-type cytochrome [Nitrospiria bacterium]
MNFKVIQVLPVFFFMLVFGPGLLLSAERDPLLPRVSKDLLPKVKEMKNPHEATPENIAKGKGLFDGRGTCYVCHGKEGKGDGAAAAGLEPSPRNFTNPAFHAARTDGELYWVIKNGSPGTAMVPMVGSTIDEDEAWYVLLYERSLNKK